jgi:spore coat protein U-like protein
MWYKLFKILSLSSSVLALSLGMTHSSYAGTTSASTQATATLSSSCTITAQNLSFGTLVLPISSQGVSSSMSVLCSKGHAYTIGLAYGGVYGQGGQSSGDYWQAATGAQTGLSCITGTPYAEYNSSGQMITASCHTSQPANPTNTVYSYGKMIGVSSGDNIAYSIQVPGNPGQIWNSGESSYSSTGTGSAQSIPVVGTLVPGQSGSTYPTPDSYMDTVTATVNF